MFILEGPQDGIQTAFAVIEGLVQRRNALGWQGRSQGSLQGCEPPQHRSTRIWLTVFAQHRILGLGKFRGFRHGVPRSRLS
ncbi:MAG: hypothetical protein HC918_03425 [Oscillatoriales cyanobacterium SM2_1_8]|nr:hypothetical protein [Oscillatoriales cyanobacterium SM2_1_8]